MNILVDRVWSVVTRTGSIKKVNFVEFICGEGDMLPVSLAFPRADLASSAYQVAISLLQTIVAPENEEDWYSVFCNGLDVETLQKAVNQYRSVFDLHSSTPAFQDPTLRNSDKKYSISNLFNDAPGENTVKHNKDIHFNRDDVTGLCPACTTWALITNQVLAAAGGSGYYVGIRGSSGVTTVPVPDIKSTLFQRIWFSVLPKTEFSQYASGNETKVGSEFIFPWLTVEERLLKKESVSVTPVNWNPLAVYWATPKRLLLEKPEEVGVCDLCGDQGQSLYRTVSKQKEGLQYNGMGWLHPLCPSEVSKGGGMAPKTFGYTQHSFALWPFLALSRTNKNEPSLVVSYAAKERGDLFAGIDVSGYTCDSAKVVRWNHSSFPYFSCPDTETNEVVSYVGYRAAEFAQWLAVKLSSKTAFLAGGNKKKTKVAPVANRFYAQMTSQFFKLMEEVSFGREPVESLESWLKLCASGALRFYEDEVKRYGLGVDMKKVVRYKLALKNDIFSKEANKILGI